MESPSQLTPMLRQYFDLKKEAEGAVLFFRMGDFYEIFGEDAEEVAPKLDVVLTARERGDQTKIPFCGVPHHAATGYWLKLCGWDTRCHRRTVGVAVRGKRPCKARCRQNVYAWLY